MGVRVEPFAEPIPGYRLIERLGGGGFGEVWKAEAPGGLNKAIKFVYGDMEEVEFEASRAKQEFKSLERIKNIHHPFILSLERFEVVEGQLLIVMELADRTMWDRFRECRTSGLDGIPRAELLAYLQETAEALDFMNSQFSLQHLDIKPQNLFLVFNHIKVADFGLVKDLNGRNRVTITGGVTPVYAAPETMDGFITPFSDQYSLAIVYVEMLTGKRPFEGSTIRQLIMQQLNGKADLSRLPRGEQEIVERALAKEPNERWGTCLEFVQKLCNVEIGGEEPIRTPSGVGYSKPFATPSPPPADPNLPHSDSSHRPPSTDTPAVSEPMCQTQVGRSSVNLRIGKKREAEPAKPPSKGSASTGGPPPIPPPLPSNFMSDSVPQPRDPARNQRRKASAEPPRPPALIMGLGSAGLNTLRQLQSQLVFLFNEVPSELKLIGLDTDPRMIQKVTSGEFRECLPGNQVMPTKLNRPSHYLKGSRQSSTEGWLNGRLIYRVPRELDSAGLRPLGRLAFVDNARAILPFVEQQLRATIFDVDPKTGQETQRPQLAEKNPRVYIVANLAGNTGSGMFLDAAYTTRHLLAKMGFLDSEIIGVFLLPPSKSPRVTAVETANTYAALAELEYFSNPDVKFTAAYPEIEGGKSKTISVNGVPFHRCVFLETPMDLSPEVGSTAVAGLAAEFLARDLISSLGHHSHNARVRCSQMLGMDPDRVHFQSFGLALVAWPRRLTVAKLSQRLCRKLIQKWMSKDAKPVAEELKKLTREKWNAMGVQTDILIEEIMDSAERRLQFKAENKIATILSAIRYEPNIDEKGIEDLTSTCQYIATALEGFDRLLGVHAQDNVTKHEPGEVERAIQEADAVLYDRLEQEIARFVVSLLENPQYRVAGAEEALRQFYEMAQALLAAQEPIALDLNEKAAQCLEKIREVMAHPQLPVEENSGFWKKSRKPSVKTPGSILIEYVRTYAKARFQFLVLRKVQDCCVSLRGHLSEQIREVGFCRQRMTELSDLVRRHQISQCDQVQSSTQYRRLLFPQGWQDLDKALDRYESELTARDLLTFDGIVQEYVKQHFNALLEVCMGAATMVRALAPAMVRMGQEYLEENFLSIDVAELLWQEKSSASNPAETEIANEMRTLFQAAAPPQSNGDLRRELCIAMIPEGPQGDRLEPFVKQLAPNPEFARTLSSDEIVIYREMVDLEIRNLKQFGPAARQTYEERIATDPTAVHIREDLLLTLAGEAIGVD